MIVKSGNVETLLPRTTYEFEQGEKLSKIKAIRGLTPKKDVKIQMSNTFSALLVSKCTMDARFRALDSQTVTLHNELIRCLRFRNQ